MGCGFVLKPTPIVRDAYADIRMQKQSAIQSIAEIQKPQLKTSRAHAGFPTDRGHVIRILHLLPGASADPLLGEFEVVALATRPKYEAISYTWANKQGDDTHSGAIHFNSSKSFISITKNCEAALRRLRLNDCERIIWIDAVCIDQSNISERNHQVRQMLLIFRSSMHITIFLGHEYPGAEEVVGYLSRYCHGRYPTSEDMLNLFRCRWFHRLWVLQEIDVPVEKTVLCGAESCSWSSLISACRFLTHGSCALGFPIEFPSIMSFGLLSDLNMQNRIKTVHRP
jgi:hypothetical protein